MCQLLITGVPCEQYAVLDLFRSFRSETSHRTIALRSRIVSGDLLEVNKLLDIFWFCKFRGIAVANSVLVLATDIHRLEPGEIRTLHWQFELLPLLRIPQPGYLLVQCSVLSQHGFNDFYLRF